MTQYERQQSDRMSMPGSRPAHLALDMGGDTIEPGKQPDEVTPDLGDSDEPDRAPDEIAPAQGDFDRPDNAPVEHPPQPAVSPTETPASPG